MKKKIFLRVVGLGILSALFCVGCGDKDTDTEEPTYHTITLDAGGGTVEPGNVTASQCPNCNTMSMSLPIPTRDGYDFRGWYEKEDGNGREVTGHMFCGEDIHNVSCGDASLYAHWSLAHYWVTFDAHGGDVTPPHDTTDDGWMLASLPTPTRADHEFVGWYTDIVGVGEKVTESKVYKGDVTLYAHWVYTGIHYTVSFDANGGTVDPPTEETDVGGILQDLPTPERDGYAFTGWFTEKSGGTAVSANTVFNSEATVYAQWILITDGMYAVTFNAHGGVVTPKRGTTGKDGKLLVPLPTPVREGFAFMGWFTEEDSVTANTVFRENTTIHAMWNIIHYTITFDATGGSVTPETAKTGSHWELDSLPTPKRDEYTFTGWYTEKTDGTHVFPKSTPLVGDISIYAHWAENPPSLVDDRDGKSHREVAIGEQIWMAENLNYAGESGDEMGVCYDNEEEHCDYSGRLYSWDEAMAACPVGWRLPSDGDWTELVEFVGGPAVAGGKLGSTTGWPTRPSNAYDYNGSDDFGFSGLPGGEGVRSLDGGLRFRQSGYRGFCWSNTKSDGGVYSALSFHGSRNSGGLTAIRSDTETFLLSVRCLKD